MRPPKMFPKTLKAAKPRVRNGLEELASLSENPGNLRGYYYLPRQRKPSAPLVVVLHGCTQDAASYDHGSGWSVLAERHGFALLYPEQKRENNPGMCFNWFTAGDSQRGMGEAASIAAMTAAMCKTHDLDPSRVYITGLSAGGAMAAVMLATYPERFAGGAIIAGVAYGCASGVGEAFDCMGGRARADAAQLGASIRRASPHKGPWPRISVWQGSADATVVPSNADAIVLQWAHVHGLDPQPTRTEIVETYPHRLWESPQGEVLIEHYTITGMAHGTPLMPGTGEGESGTAGAHMLDARISSTDRIAAFFGVAPPPPERQQPAPAPRKRRTSEARPQIPDGVQSVIETALRAAGLMR